MVNKGRTIKRLKCVLTLELICKRRKENYTNDKLCNIGILQEIICLLPQFVHVMQKWTTSNLGIILHNVNYSQTSPLSN